MAWPEGFAWGTAGSSTGAEGAAPASDWSLLERAGSVPPSQGGNGFGQRYPEDFAAFRTAGFTHHRMGVEWARIEPRAGRVDHGELERYRRILLSAREAGLVPWVDLLHFSQPGWFADDEGGFRRDVDRARYLFARHVDLVAESLGDLVGGWQPVHEPGTFVSTYLGATMSADEQERLDDVLAGVHRAAADAARILRGGGAPVIASCAVWPVFRHDDSAEARHAAARLEHRWWRSWNQPELLSTYDLLAFTYRAAVAVDGTGSAHPYPALAPVGPLGLAPWPEGLTLSLERLAAEQPLPLVVDDLGVATRSDDRRADHLADCLERVRDAISAGIGVRGVFVTGVDGYEWRHGFGVPNGLWERDRTPRPSLQAICDIIKG